MSTEVESGQQTLEFEGGDLFEFGGSDTDFGAADSTASARCALAPGLGWR